jgi:hypothetical protein
MTVWFTPPVLGPNENDIKKISLLIQTIVGDVKDTAENLFLQLSNRVSNSKYL